MRWNKRSLILKEMSNDEAYHVRTGLLDCKQVVGSSASVTGEGPN
jgi:hypothetical protein